MQPKEFYLYGDQLDLRDRIDDLQRELMKAYVDSHNGVDITIKKTTFEDLQELLFYMYQ